jgi:two-component system LytT family response regulator
VGGVPARRIAVGDGKHYRFVDLSDVTRIVAQAGGGVVVHTGGAELAWRISIGRAEELLGDGAFVRVHRSALVNARRVRELRAEGNGQCAILLDDGAVVLASRSLRDLLALFYSRCP